jgi:ATP-dependent DNA ligase
MKIVKSSPILHSTTKNGNTKFWVGHITQEGDGYFLQSESWQTLASGEESKHNESIPYAVTIKNIGKKNETAPLEQAESELASMVKSQKDKKNYIEKGKKVVSGKLPLPQLAHKYRDHAKKIKFPAFEQAKYDGTRCICDGTKAQTRGGQPFIPEVVAHIMFDTDNFIIDGELLLPGNVPLQTTVSATKKFRPDISPTLIYWVYDIVDETLNQTERLAILKGLESKFPPNVRLVETTLVNNEEELQKRHEQHVLDGYEGTIVRNTDGKYLVGHRSYDLQKKKDFEEAEFKVIGCRSGEGLYKDCAIFRCVTAEGEEFDCNPEGTIELKKRYYTDRDSYINKWLTIRYFSKSISGKPGFNVGVCFRDEGEFDK